MTDRAYRYLDAQWGPKFWNLGLVGISTTRSVAAIEGRQRDENDAAIAVNMQHHITGQAADAPLAVAAAQRVGIRIENASDIKISVRRVEQQPGYMFCMSKRPDCLAFEGKPWVFEIVNLNAFARELVLSSGGRLPLVWDARPVKYFPREFDAFDAEGVSADPFIKAAGRGYEEEEEVRIFWPTFNDPPARFSVLSTAALRHVRLIKQP